MSSRIAFTLHDSRLLGLLVSQAGISISNAVRTFMSISSLEIERAPQLLFRSLQQATKANLKMISTQKAALEETRKSREDALKATKVLFAIIDSQVYSSTTDQKQLPRIHVP